MELVDKYLKIVDDIENFGYGDNVKKKRRLLDLRQFIKRSDTQKKQAKAYQQAVARFMVDYPQYSYDLQGYILEEQAKLKK